MKQNTTKVDRILRVLAAIVIAVLYFTNVITGTTGILLLVLAGVFVLTSLVSFYPLYSTFGVNTWAVKARKYTRLSEAIFPAASRKPKCRQWH